MYTTLTDHILREQKDHATPDLFLILHQIENAGKVIASHVKATGLVDILGKTGKQNTFGEEVQKLDEFANTLLVNNLLTCGQVHAVVSEELEAPVYAEKKHDGNYIVYFDPLDGSSNIDTNSPIGTIFAVYHKDGGIHQPGRKQLAAGYIIYGSSVMFVYTTGHGLHGFTLDPAIGSFLLSHLDMKIPDEGAFYSINEGYTRMYDDAVKHYLDHVKDSRSYRGRFVGSLIADAHRTFIKGGIFLYPGYTKHPHGKLRLTIEVNPFAFLTEQAGGIAYADGLNSPLDIIPKDIHQRSPFIMGSKKNIEEYTKFIK